MGIVEHALACTAKLVAVSHPAVEEWARDLRSDKKKTYQLNTK